MKAKCPECKKMNKVIPEQNGFYYDTVEYKCKCGYYLRISALNFKEAFELMKKELNTSTSSVQRM